MFAVLSGLFAGFLHVLSGPDHLVAVAPLAVGRQRRAWSAGLRWGLGHSAGVALVGLSALALREALPLALIASVGERLVGAVLIGVGIWSLRQALRIQVHVHAHEHDGSRHEHLHVHAADHVHPEVAVPHAHPHAAFGIGTLHGLAGSSHLIGVLPSLAFPTRLGSVLYLAAFAAGTVAAMACFSSALGLLAAASGADRAGVYRGLMGVCSVAAFGVGGWWLVNGG